MHQQTRHFHAGHGPALHAWFAAHPETRLRLRAVGNGYFVEVPPCQ